MELPDTFEGLVALNITDAASLWRTRLDMGVIVPLPGGGFAHSLWMSLACIPGLLFAHLGGKRVEARRRRLDRAKGPVVDATLPELRQHLADVARQKKEVAAAVDAKLKSSPVQTAVLWISMIIAFTVFWQFLNHRIR